VTGQKFPDGGAVNRILVAYDGSGHAARALTVAAALSARPGVSCTLVTIASSEDAGREILDPAEAYLCRHGVSPQRHVAVGSRPSEMICELVTSSAAQILIMGAYGHRPVREMLFGSTTERVLSHCSVAVVLQS
jgi:nucleotide-binding universal stress UspA family protein